MKLVTIAGPPSTGKTAIILHAIRALRAEDVHVGVVKFDCLTTDDAARYEEADVPVKVGISGSLCPDHFFISNIEDCVQWAKRLRLDLLITESAGLCNRCSPHIKGVKAVCVIDNLMGLSTPKKIGPMLKLADIAVITKGDIVSQAEREVFAFRIRQTNSKCLILNVNGITGQGCFELSHLLLDGMELETLLDERLRFTMPAALCSYCLGERRIGYDYQMGNVRKMDLQ